MSKSKGITLPVHEALLVVHGHTTEILMPYAPEYRGHLAIYADPTGDGVRAALQDPVVQEVLKAAGYGKGKKGLPFGAVVGVARLVSMREAPAPGGFLWGLASPRPIEPIALKERCAGPALWPVDAELAVELNRALGAQKQSAGAFERATGASQESTCEKVTSQSSKGKSA